MGVSANTACARMRCSRSHSVSSLRAVSISTWSRVKTPTSAGVMAVDVSDTVFVGYVRVCGAVKKCRVPGTEYRVIGHPVLGARHSVLPLSYRAFHLQLDQPVELHRVLQR